MPNLLDRLVGWALAACLGMMTCIVFVSVVFRYVLNSPLSWTEELASLLFAWLTLSERTALPDTVPTSPSTPW